MPTWPVNHKHSVEVESRSVEVGILSAGGKREDTHLVCHLVDADDRIEAAVGYPRSSVRANDDAMRCRAPTQRHLGDGLRRWVEVTEEARPLAGEPDPAIDGWRDVVRAGPAGDRERGQFVRGWRG